MWSLIRSEPISEGWRRVELRTYRHDDGREYEFEILAGKMTVCVLALTSENDVVLAKQFRPGPQKFLCELPGGGIDTGEEPITAAARELLEETGYAGDIEPMGGRWCSAYSTEYTYHFLVRNCVKVQEPVFGPQEETEVVLLSVDDFKTQLLSGELTDTGTGYAGLIKAGLL